MGGNPWISFNTYLVRKHSSHNCSRVPQVFVDSTQYFNLIFKYLSWASSICALRSSGHWSPLPVISGRWGNTEPKLSRLGFIFTKIGKINPQLDLDLLNQHFVVVFLCVMFVHSCPCLIFVFVFVVTLILSAPHFPRSATMRQNLIVSMQVAPGETDIKWRQKMHKKNVWRYYSLWFCPFALCHLIFFVSRTKRSPFLEH